MNSVFLLQETSEEFLLKKLKKFYSIQKNFEFFLEVMKPEYAKRVIEWFITIYSKQNGINIVVNNKITNAYSEYQRQLRIHTKNYFDPFRRNQKIEFNVNSKILKTTLGQLNFFKWLIETNLIHYILDRDSYKKIKEKMKRDSERVSNPINIVPFCKKI